MNDDTFVLFLPPAITLLVRMASKQRLVINDLSRSKALSWRLLIYFVSIFIAFALLLLVLSLQLYLNRPRFIEGARSRMECLYLNQGRIVDECYEGWSFWYGWFILVASILPIFSFGSLVLSCNDRNVKRWSRWFCRESQQTKRLPLLDKDDCSVNKRRSRHKKRHKNNKNNKKKKNVTHSEEDI